MIVSQRAEHAFALSDKCVPFAFPAPRDGPQNRRKPRTPVAILGRKISPTEKGFELRREPRTERPPTMAGERLHVGHVNLVHVGPLLAVHFDRDEVLVQNRRHRLILKRLVRHHVTPVTRRITDAQKNRLFLRPRPRKRRFAPRQPRHRILRMLEQIGRFFREERIGHPAITAGPCASASPQVSHAGPPARGHFARLRAGGGP